MDEEKPKHRPSISQLSKTPSWVMLGFILGGLFVWALPRHEPEPPRPIVIAAAPAKPVRPPEAPQITTIEAVFDEWSSYAVWDDDVTQVALWSPALGEFADFYEVRRIDGTNYFRSLPRLTNRIIRHGKLPPPECPLRFAETEEQYRDWREQGRFERPPEDFRPAITAPQYTPSVPVPVPSTSITPMTPPMPPIEKDSGSSGHK